MRRAPELLWALLAMAAITALYRAFARPPATAAGELIGHSLGVLGFLLMLATETLYSIRKRVRGRAWGPMRSWLRAHIFMGIVGAYLVLLHASWSLGGLAGWTMLATVVVVASGFTGRYLYTAVPRTAEGDEAELAGDEPQRTMAMRARRVLALWHVVHVPLGMVLFTLAFVHIAAAIYFAGRLE